ncbi:uncharacterized protein LOC144919371 [Branchiostoma floridae x Branchiostoma belcheri]
MKTALLFLACLVAIKAQFWTPLAPCDGNHQCPGGEEGDSHCCRTGIFGVPVCEIAPHPGWPCDPAGVGSCPCWNGYECVFKPNSTTEALCVQAKEE